MSMVRQDNTDIQQAHRIWEEFALSNDVSGRMGQTAGIDPVTGQILFGESASDIVAQMDAAGEFRPLYFVRVGEKEYFRKGGRR